MILSYEEKLSDMGVNIPAVPKPVAAYIPAVRAGSCVYTSGQLPLVDGKLMFSGKIDRDLSMEEGCRAARLCVINCLAAIKSVLGTLDNIERIVKVTGFVNSISGFTGQPQVINGASDFLIEVFGEKGQHARAAVGVSELPLDSAVEIEMIALVKEP
ncbi:MULTISPECIES: RidA family protein [Pelotomaculum]|uniref:RidA family protein n=1 Tax=Pelotomaculum TaxID=191373 RepID=UPI00289FF193|nr:RidA family protein [Pelotomaculum terephthalicicum]